MSKKSVIYFKRFMWFIVVVAVIASVFMYPSWYLRQVNKVQGIYYVAKGDKYLRKGKFQKAIAEYNHGLELYPEHYGAWFNLGNIYVAYEDFYSAMDAYEKAISYNPNYVLARMNYGIISTEKIGDFDGAIEQYNKIIEIRRKLVYIPFVFNNLKSYKTNIGLAYYNRGVAYKQKYNYNDNTFEDRHQYLMEAISSYKQAVEILKNDYDANYNLALAYHLNGDYNLAGLTYCRAIELGPTQYEAHYNLAVLLNHLKYYKEALKEFHKANTLVTQGTDNPNQTRYFFDVLNDVTRKILSEEDGFKYMSQEFEIFEGTSSTGLLYLNGKLLTEEELEEEMLKNYKTCAGKDIFRDEDNLDDEEFEN